MIREISRRFKRIAILAIVAAISLGTVQANAYCVYNHTQLPISDVRGETCDHCLQTSISKGGKACCPGGEKGCRGKTWITVSVPNTVYQTGMHYGYCGAQVTAHGWVKIYGGYGGGQFFRCEVYDDKGHLIWNDMLKDGTDKLKTY